MARPGNAGGGPLPAVHAHGPQSVSYPLLPGVHAVAVDGDLVFLSVLADAYLCLPGLGDRITLDATGGALWINDPDLASQLFVGRLIGRAAPPAEDCARKVPSLPTRSALRSTYGRPCWRDLGPAAGAVLDFRWRYRGRSFATILQSVRVRRLSPLGAPSAELLKAVDEFHRWAPYAPLPGKCLVRSYLLLRRLRQRGHDALWVFGVRTWHFQAHCWLQCGEVILDDEADRVAAYSPILAV